MASRFTKYSKYIRRSAVAGTPVTTSEAATLPRPRSHPRKTATADSSGSPNPAKLRSPRPKNPSKPLPELPPFIESPYHPVFLPATLTFSFEQGKRHLIQADARFEKIFEQLKCQPFEQLEPTDPFQKLLTYVLGKHITWSAAKALRHRFLRLFDRSLPEKVLPGHEEEIKYKFPSPDRIASVNEEFFKDAGLSVLKAGYVLDLADRFADGRLSTEKLANASDEEAVEMLTAVRGIGKPSAFKLAMFYLRRPDVLPVDDLGAQRGLLRWVISSHEPDQHPLCIDPKNLPKTNKGELEKPGEVEVAEPGEAIFVFPAPGKPPRLSSKQGNRILPVPTNPIQLPEGITLEMLKARENGEKVEGRCYLLPNEMEALTASWKPYRSLGVFYLWAVVDGSKDSKPRRRRRRKSDSVDDPTQPGH